MASTDEQSARTGVARRRNSPVTRERLLRAAAELIAEVGWGRVTTRAVAARAGLPHGTVSYHFAGKQELLRETATNVVEQAMPIADLRAAPSLADLLAMIGRLGDPEGLDPVLSGVMLEAMRESARDAELRERMAELGRSYRGIISELIAAERQDDDTSGATPEALATLIVAASDGLLLHTMFDPGLDITDALHALQRIIGGN